MIKVRDQSEPRKETTDKRENPQGRSFSIPEVSGKAWGPEWHQTHGAEAKPKGRAAQKTQSMSRQDRDLYHELRELWGSQSCRDASLGLIHWQGNPMSQPQREALWPHSSDSHSSAEKIKHFFKSQLFSDKYLLQLETQTNIFIERGLILF